MIKLWMLLLTLGAGIVKEDFVVEEETVEKTEECVVIDGFKLIDDGTKQIISKNDYHLITFPKEAKLTYCLHNQKLVIASLTNSHLKITETDYLGKVLIEKEFQSSFTNVEVISFKGYLYIIGGVNNVTDEEVIVRDYHKKTNAIVIKLNSNYEIEKGATFGGKLNDRFLKVDKDDKYLYISGAKDTLSGGDFGNGGNSLTGFPFLILDEDLNIMKYVTFKDEVINWLNFNDSIYVLTKNTLYVMDKELNCENCREISSLILFSKFIDNNTLLIIDETGLKFYDLTYLKIIKSFPYDDVISVITDYQSIYLRTNDKITKLNIYDIRSFDYETNSNELINEKINNLFNDIDLTKKEITPTYDPLVKGTYTVIYYYGEFTLEGKIIVPEEINITSGVIYPVGYRLKFTGVAYLNGVLVNNNHALMKTGDQELIIYDNLGSPTKYEFYVSSNQINFNEESIKDYNLEVKQNEEFTLSFELGVNEDLEIAKVYVNDKETPFTIDNDKLIIKLKESISGIYNYHLQGIEYISSDKTYTLNLDINYTVKVLNPSLQVSANLTNDKKHILYNGNVDDVYNQVRGFKVYLRGNGEEVVYPYAVKTSDIVLRGLDDKSTYEITFTLDYALNDKDLEELELMTATIGGKSDIRLGSIEIIQTGESLEKFQIALDHKYVTEVYSLKKLVYEEIPEDFFKPIFSGLFIGTILGVTIIYIRLKKRWSIFK